jgi:hypothetical protein
MVLINILQYYLFFSYPKGVKLIYDRGEMAGERKIEERKIPHLWYFGITGQVILLFLEKRAFPNPCGKRKQKRSELYKSLDKRGRNKNKQTQEWPVPLESFHFRVVPLVFGSRVCSTAQR